MWTKGNSHNAAHLKMPVSTLDFPVEHATDQSVQSVEAVP